jgi:hypothetical protein
LIFVLFTVSPLPISHFKDSGAREARTDTDRDSQHVIHRTGCPTAPQATVYASPLARLGQRCGVSRDSVVLFADAGYPEAIVGGRRQQAALRDDTSPRQREPDAEA